MKTRSHRFDEFLNRVAYWFIQDKNFQAVVDASGINFETMGFKNLGAESVQKYLAAYKETNSHEYAKEQVKQELGFLNQYTNTLIVSDNYESLAAEFDKLLSEEAYLLLAEMLSQNPQNGKEILDRFQINAPTFAKGGVVKELMKTENEKFAIAQKEKTVCRILRDYPKLSNMIGGFNSGRLTILTGRTGFGKTNLGLSLALSAQKDYGVAYINMEMGYEDIFKRLAVNILDCKYDDLSNLLVYTPSTMDMRIDEELTEEFFMTDGKSLSIKEIFGAIKAKNREFSRPIKILIIDYDQRLSRVEVGSEDMEWRYLLQDAMKLEDFAKEQDLHVILMCQLNRQGFIAASQRMLNIAHTWLDFYKDDDVGVVIHAKKNRHGPTGRAIRCRYESAKVVERDELEMQGC